MAKSKKVSSDWKKKNYNSSVKVSEAEVQKLRAAGSKSAAIKKYGSDPKMREALNRFYGKAEVTRLAGGSASSSSSTTTPRGGPGAKMPKKPVGGPGAKMTARDGRGAATSKPGASNKSKSSTSSKSSKSMMIPGRNLSKMTPAQRKRNDQLAKFGKDVLLPASLAAIPVAGVSGGLAAAGAKSAAVKLGVKQTAAKNVAARATAKADEAIKLQKAATAAKNAAKTGRGSGAGSAARAAKLQRDAATAKKAADALAKQARNANARAKSLGTPKAPTKTGPKSKTASPKAATSGTAKQADEMLMRIGKLPLKYKKTTAGVAGAAYLSRPRKNEK
jgi:hypothetical protein